MYSPEIVDRRLRQAKVAGLKFNRLPRDVSLDVSAKLERLRLSPNGELLPNGQLSRPLDTKEQEFIASERIICRADFEYYAVRYHTINRDPGVGTESGIGPSTFLESQKRVLQLIGRREEVCHAEFKKHKHTAGILVYVHKVRQVAVTDWFRRASLHRMSFWPGTRSFAASTSDDNVGELYDRDKLAINNLPFWLKPSIYPDVKNTQIGFEHPLNCTLRYQAENEKVGIGTGTQVDFSHLTEVPLWKYWPRVRYSFIPSLPKAISTLHVQEGTSAGKGDFWQTSTEGCRNREVGYEDWIYIFLPWYQNLLKYRKNAPDDWTPSEHTVKHAQLIERTSPEFCDGITAHPTRDQLYWWETERAVHAKNGETASFLANYPATPEQSFVNWASGALPVEIIEQMELEVRQPMIYEVQVAL